jgi:hypothetical protein
MYVALLGVCTALLWRRALPEIRGIIIQLGKSLLTI